MIGLVVVVAFGLLFGWRPHNGVLPTLAGFGLVAVFTFTVLWLGVLLGMAMSNLETIESVGGLVAVVFSFLSTGFLSVDKLPGWIQPIAQWNPVSSVISACRDLWGNGSPSGTGFPAENPSLVILVSLGLLFAMVTAPLLLHLSDKPYTCRRPARKPNCAILPLRSRWIRQYGAVRQ